MSFETPATNNFQCSFADFYFIIITKVLMNELDRMLIDHLKFLDFWVFFKMLLTVCPVIVDKELWTWLWSSNFQNSTFQKITITVTDVNHMQVYFMTFCSKQKIKKNTQYRSIFILFKKRSAQNKRVPFCSYFSPRFFC